MYYLIENNIQNCIILGSGPAGYSAAIYSARFELTPVLFLGDQPGGQLVTTNKIDNYLGFPHGIDGNFFMDQCKKQATRFNVRFINESVNKVKFSDKIGGIHTVFFGEKNIRTKGIIIATGSRPKTLGLHNEKRLIGHGISFCATCDGFFYRKKNVAIVGGGDTALEEADYLSNICNQVTIIVRKGYFRASKILQNRIMNKNNISILFYSTIVQIINDNFLEKIKIYNSKRDEYMILSINGLFIAIGHIPNTEIFKEQVNLDNNGLIITNKNNMQTNKPGVFAAGDVQDNNYRQAITSAGTGCMAAIDLDKYLYLI